MSSDLTSKKNSSESTAKKISPVVDSAFIVETVNKFCLDPQVSSLAPWSSEKELLDKIVDYWGLKLPQVTDSSLEGREVFLKLAKAMVPPPSPPWKVVGVLTIKIGDCGKITYRYDRSGKTSSVEFSVLSEE